MLKQMERKAILFRAVAADVRRRILGGTEAPIATNSSGTNLFQLNESNPLQFPQRFYRAVVVP